MDRRTLIEQLYERFAGGRLEEIRPQLHPDVVFVNPGDAIEPGIRRGPEEFIAALAGLHELFDYEGADLERWAARGDRALAVVRFRLRGKGSGAPLSEGFAHLLEFDGDRLVGLEWFRDEAAGRIAFDAVTVDDVRALALSLPRTTEALVHDRVKFRVGQIVYVALSRDETLMGFAFPKDEREALVESDPEKFRLPRQSDMRFNWVVARLAALDLPEMRELVLDAWRMVVPKKVAAAYDDAPAPHDAA